MRHNPQPQEMYRHFKGNLYQIRCLAKHSETDEILVIYQAMYGDFQIYARGLTSFMEEVDREKYPDASQVYRFELFDVSTPVSTASGAGETMTMKMADEGSDVHVNEESNVQLAQESNEQLTKESSAWSDEDSYGEEELNIDPLVLQFLDADSYEKRLEILSLLHSRIDDDMINTMAVAVDIEVKDGDIEERYTELKNCLLTFEKYECNRLR